MLRELAIRNFAIIDDLKIAFDDGLTILSGETGAGKSIIINAVNLLLGSRASAKLVRTGADAAELEALFDIPADCRVAEVMRAADYDASEGLLVRRVIAANDRHRIYINGRLATMQVLKTLTANLASISGQHAHQGLLKEEQHLAILDQFGNLVGLREQTAQLHQQIVPLLEKLKDYRRREQQQAEHLELLTFQQAEIEQADLQPGEDDALEAERTRLKNAANLQQTVQHGIAVLYSADGAVVERLAEVGKRLEQATRVDTRLKPITDQLNGLMYQLEDSASELRDYLQTIEMDEAHLEEVEQRLDMLNKLKRKYGGSLDAVLDHRDRIEKELARTRSIGKEIEATRNRLASLHGHLAATARELSAQRRQVAEQLGKHVEKELATLKMTGTRFEVLLSPNGQDDGAEPFLTVDGYAVNENGMERAAFLIAPNVGEALKPLAGIASGGELSRVVLALKAILAHNDAVETVVFDEVDAGIGGSVAEVVGRKLEALARFHQIVCITHLPQIAMYGDRHFRISKHVNKGRTHTRIEPVEADARVHEIARMLGGLEITSTTLDHAREMLGRK